jgi:uncharacterized protein (DUF362 family)
MTLRAHEVVAYREARARYAATPPFDPEERYAEFGSLTTGPENPAFAAVRACFRLAGLDATHFGGSAWNPLGDLLRPGESVLLKPNFVKESHPRDPLGWRYVLTHGSVLRALAEYVFLAVGPSGRVVVADAPQTDSSFVRVVDVLGMREVARQFAERGLRFDLVDLRKEEWESDDGVVQRRRTLAGDPHGYVAFDLADRSEFTSHGGAGHYYGADYDAGTVNAHHRDGRHEYLLAATPFHVDAVISVPKLKTHKKAGVTIGLKNLIGINGDKNWLPHHTENSAGASGDEHPVKADRKHGLERRLVGAARAALPKIPFVGPRLHWLARQAGKRVFGDTEAVVRSGNWWGNDTIWRTCLDLNKALAFGEADGTMRPAGAEPRRHFALVDGLVAGQGRGPMNPDPMPLGLVAFGLNVPSVDAACTAIMGFVPARVPIIAHAFATRGWALAPHALDDVRVRSNEPAWSGPLGDVHARDGEGFVPHFGWKGHIERGSP